MNEASEAFAHALAALRGEGESIDAVRILLSLGASSLVSLWIIAVYLARSPRPTRGFALSLCGLAQVTALVILPISSNVILSLGMVGALSIVRFRAAIKDPLDVVFMFWAIAVGISSGAGFYIVSTLGSAIIGVTLLLLGALPLLSQQPVLLILRYDPEADLPLLALLPPHRVRSRSQDARGIELVIEPRRSPPADLLGRLLAVPGARDAQIVEVLAEG